MTFSYLHCNSRLPGEPGSDGVRSVFYLHLIRNRISGMWPRFFYGLDVLPVMLPTVSEHRREHTALTSTSRLASTFLHPPPDSWWKRRCFLLRSSPTPVPVMFYCHWRIGKSQRGSLFCCSTLSLVITFECAPGRTENSHQCRQLRQHIYLGPRKPRHIVILFFCAIQILLLTYLLTYTSLDQQNCSTSNLDSTEMCNQASAPERLLAKHPCSRKTIDVSQCTSSNQQACRHPFNGLFFQVNLGKLAL